MYSIYVKFTCLDNKREAFVQRVKNEGILDEIRKENGCILYDYYFSESDKNVLLLIEKWESLEHQQIHIAQKHMAALREFKDEYIKSTELKEFELK